MLQFIKDRAESKHQAAAEQEDGSAHQGLAPEPAESCADEGKGNSAEMGQNVRRAAQEEKTQMPSKRMQSAQQKPLLANVAQCSRTYIAGELQTASTCVEK